MFSLEMRKNNLSRVSEIELANVLTKKVDFFVLLVIPTLV